MLNKIMPVLVGVLVIVAIASYVFYQKYLIAATVNGKTISRLEVVEELEKQGGKKVLDTIVTQELIMQQAKKENITVSQKEIDAELKKIEASVTSQGTTLDEALKQKGMSRDDLIKQIKLQVMVQRLVKGDTIKISDEEVTKYMEANKEQFPPDAKEKPNTDQIKESLKQEKLQAKIEEYISNLHAKAKITSFGVYK